MINPISTRPPELPSIQDPAATGVSPGVAPADSQPKTDAPDGIQSPQSPADGEIVIKQDIGSILQDIGTMKFPTLPPSTPLPTIDLPPSEQQPGPIDPTKVRFPTKE